MCNLSFLEGSIRTDKVNLPLIALWSFKANIVMVFVGWQIWSAICCVEIAVLLQNYAAFIMTDGMRQTQQDSCTLIILYNFTHRLFIWFLSEPRAAKRKRPVEWTLEQVWCYSIARHQTIRNERFILIWLESCSPDDDSRLGMWLCRFKVRLSQLLRAACGFASPHQGTASEVPAWLLVSNSSSRAGEELQAGPFKPQKQKSPQGISNLLYRWTSAVLNYCHGKGLKSYFCMCLFGWQKRAIWAQRNMELLYTALKREFSLCLIFKS